MYDNTHGFSALQVAAPFADVNPAQPPVAPMTVAEMQEYYNSLSEEAKLEFTEDGTLSYEDIPDETEESGFDIPTDLLEKVISEVPF